MDVAGIEDVLIDTVKALGIFATVDSAGRDQEPSADTVFSFPYASAFFIGDREVAKQPRPIDELTFGVLVSVKNVRGESAAAADAYALIDSVRLAIRGKTLGIEDIGPFGCPTREMVGYQDGVMTYLLIFTCRQYQPLVGE